MFLCNFSYFHWSTCSAGEYHFKADNWDCLSNNPFNKTTLAGNWTYIEGDVSKYSFSLDDQCRMEFGDGFGFCESFQVIFILSSFPSWQ